MSTARKHQRTYRNDYLHSRRYLRVFIALVYTVFERKFDELFTLGPRRLRGTIKRLGYTYRRLFAEHVPVKKPRSLCRRTCGTRECTANVYEKPFFFFFPDLFRAIFPTAGIPFETGAGVGVHFFSERFNARRKPRNVKSGFARNSGNWTRAPDFLDRLVVITTYREQAVVVEGVVNDQN